MGFKGRLYRSIAAATDEARVDVSTFKDGKIEGVVAVACDDEALTPRVAHNVAESRRLLVALTRNLIRYQGNVSVIAREMDVHRVQVRRWCRRFGLAPAAYRR